MSNLLVYGINFTDPTLLMGLGVIGGFIVLMLLIFIIKLCRLGVKKLSFDTNGGNKIKSLKYRKGKKVYLESLPNPEKDGDTFIEWCDNITLSTKLTSFIMPNNHKTIYAKWQSDIEKEMARKEAEKRKKTVKPVEEKPKNEPKPQAKPLYGELKQQTRPAQATAQAAQSKPTQAAQSKPVQNVEVKTTQTAKPRVEQSNQAKPAQPKSQEYQYQFKEKTDIKSTYAYSKYNQEYQEKLEKKEEENKKLYNYEKLALISSELHFSIDSLKVLDNQNIEILYKKALKSKSDRERYVHTKEQQVQAAYRKHDEYSNKPKPEGVAGLGGGQSAKSYYTKPVQETKPAEEATVKPTQNVVKEEEPTNEYSRYEQMFGNIVAEEVVEEDTSYQNTVEQKEEPKVEPKVEQKTESKNDDFEVPSVNDVKNNKEEKLDELNKSIDKLNSELEIIKNLLLKNMK